MAYFLCTCVLNILVTSKVNSTRHLCKKKKKILGNTMIYRIELPKRVLCHCFPALFLQQVRYPLKARFL